MHNPTTGRPSRTPTPDARHRTVSGATASTSTSTPPRQGKRGLPAPRPSFGDYHPDDHVNRPTAAALMAVSPRTTEDWARDGKGPPFRKLGTGRSARIVYRVGDVLEWLNAQARSSTTSDPGAA